MDCWSLVWCCVALNFHILDHGGVMGCGFCRYDITTAEIDNLEVTQTHTHMSYYPTY